MPSRARLDCVARLCHRGAGAEQSRAKSQNNHEYHGGQEANQPMIELDRPIEGVQFTSISIPEHVSSPH
jgi:hypothetical protein